MLFGCTDLCKEAKFHLPPSLKNENLSELFCFSFRLSRFIKLLRLTPEIGEVDATVK